MSKPLIKRLESLEQKISPNPDKTIILRMRCPGAKTAYPRNGRVRIEPSNPEDAEL